MRALWTSKLVRRSPLIRFGLASAAAFGGYGVFAQDNAAITHGDESPVPQEHSAPAGAAEEEEEISVSSYDVVLVGAGLCSYMALRTIKQEAPDKTVLIVGDEQEEPYMRPPLTKSMWNPDASVQDLTFPATEQEEGESSTRTVSLYSDYEKYLELPGVTCEWGTKISRIDAENHTLSVDGERRSIVYDQCLLATGVMPKKLAHVDETCVDRVSTYKTIKDFKRVHDWSQNANNRIVVVGAGYLGTELAASLAHSACSVALVAAGDTVMNKALPQYLGEALGAGMAQAGVDLHCGSRVTSVTRDEGDVLVTLENGESLAADYVVSAVGTRADTRLIAFSGLEVDEERGGVVANSQLQVVDGLYAGGDCVSFYDVSTGRRRRVPHVDHATMTGKIAALNMINDKKQVYKYLPVQFGSIGSSFNYEAVGVIDASLRTVSVWDKDAPQFTRGVVYYVDEEDGILGVLIVGMDSKASTAGRLVRYAAPVGPNVESVQDLIFFGDSWA